MLNAFLGINSLHFTGWNNREYTDYCEQAISNYAEEGAELTDKAIQVILDICPMYSIIELQSLDAHVAELNTSALVASESVSNGMERLNLMYFD